MAEAAREPAVRKRREAVESFVGALVKSARTIVLYKPGHALIPQIVERVRTLLTAAVGDEPNLQLDIKAKQLLLDEEPLAEGPETVGLAVALHTLGVGQVLFTSRVSSEGLEQFMRLLTWKADEKRTLTDLQKAAQEVRIDGLQLISIMSFVVTGEQEESTQRPGELTEEELRAVEAAPTVPDFLHLLLRQNERLTSREAEQLSALLDQALAGELAAEDFAAQMPWSYYDPRVRARWDALRAELAGRTRWSRDALISSLSLAEKEDRAALADHHAHDAASSFAQTLAAVKHLLDAPVGERQPRFALQAYRRLLEDMARGGRVEALLAEFALWRAKAGDARWGAYLSALRPEVERIFPVPAVAEGLVRRLAERGAEAGVTDELRDFALSVGPALMPLLVDELRRVSDKTAQKSLCALLAQLARKLGAGAVAEALKDEDYYVVVQALGILDEIAYPEMARQAAPLLDHAHPKVRAAVVRALGKAGGAGSAAALGGLIAGGKHPDEAKLAAMTLSLMQGVEAERLLLDAYRANADYDTRVAVATALGRLPTPQVEAFLAAITRQSFVEWLKGLFGRFTGAPRDLREAALHSLAEVRKELHGKKG